MREEEEGSVIGFNWGESSSYFTVLNWRIRVCPYSTAIPEAKSKNEEEERESGLIGYNRAWYISFGEKQAWFDYLKGTEEGTLLVAVRLEVKGEVMK